MNLRAPSVASSPVRRLWAAPLCGMALWNSPRAAGRPRSVPTLMPPADSPKMVTLAGSPPKAEMLSRTHSRAATWSRMPLLPWPSMWRKPNAPSR